MAIVKYKNPKTGVEYAYESTACWDPETHRNHPKRTYLGRVDPTSGEIIKTSGKRGKHGKPAFNAEQKESENHPAVETDRQYQELRASLDEAQAHIQLLQAQNEMLSRDNARMRMALTSIWTQSGEFTHQV